MHAAQQAGQQQARKKRLSHHVSVLLVPSFKDGRVAEHPSLRLRPSDIGHKMNISQHLFQRQETG
jgi:hypothetical protein